MEVVAIAIFVSYLTLSYLCVSVHRKALPKTAYIILQAANLISGGVFLLYFTSMKTGTSLATEKIAGAIAFPWFYISCCFIMLTLLLKTVSWLLAKNGITIPGNRKTVFYATAAATLALAIAGHCHYIKINVKEYGLGNGENETRVVFVSDVHLGSGIGAERLAEYVRKINSLEPDIVLIGGDLIDRDADIPFSERCDTLLKGIKAPLGTYGVFGNHEYYGNSEERAALFYEKSGIKRLENDTITLEGKIFLAGIDDRADSSRIRELCKMAEKADTDTGKGLYKIAVKHRPDCFDRFSASGYDLSISGHTHNGQFFPGNILVKLANSYTYGLYNLGNGHKGIVSSGLGLWGPKFRNMSRSEIVLLRIRS